MTTNFAAAMRRAGLSARAYDPIEATRIIQDALAQQTGFRQPAADSKRRPSLRLIDPGAEIIPSSRTQHEPMQRKSLGDVLQMLKDGKSRFQAFDSLRNRSVGTPPPPLQMVRNLSLGHSACAFLTEIVRGGMAFLEALIAAVRTEMPSAPEGVELTALYAKAGLTTFRRITKAGTS